VPTPPGPSDPPRHVAMPCRRSSLSSVVTSSRMVDLLLATQAVVAAVLASGASLSCKCGLDARWLGRGIEPCHDIEDVFGAQRAGFHHQFHGHQHRIEPAVGTAASTCAMILSPPA
jgi:hypothetical protein